MAAPRPQPTLESVSRPKQARSAQTLARILDAAEELILEKGLHDASIPEIVRRAGSSVGGFYARFRDKNELLRALEERFFLEISTRVDVLADPARWQGARLTQVIEVCARELVTMTRERRNLVAAFVHRATQDEELKAESLRFRAAVSQRAARFLLLWRHEMTHPDPARAVDLGVQMALALMLQSVLVGDLRVRGRVLSDGDLAREVARSFLAYLGAPVPAVAPGEDS